MRRQQLMTDNIENEEKDKEEFAKDDAIRAGCGCMLGVIVFFVILFCAIFSK